MRAKYYILIIRFMQFLCKMRFLIFLKNIVKIFNHVIAIIGSCIVLLSFSLSLNEIYLTGKEGLVELSPARVTI